MRDRRYTRIPVEQVKVLNPRDREQKQFEDNIRNIGAVGLLKPIVANERYLDKSGKYELVCGEGRLLAHRQLGKTEIDAEVVDVDRKQALLMSLVENIARVTPGTMWFAKEVARMHQAGIFPGTLISSFRPEGTSSLLSTGFSGTPWPPCGRSRRRFQAAWQRGE